MTKSEQTPVVVGYISFVENEPVPCVEQQQKAIEEYARQIDLEYAGTYTDHRPAGHALPHWRRPALATLLDKLDPGDHLILWRLCRLDPSFRGCVAALKRLVVDRRVVVHTIADFDNPRELGDDLGRGLLTVLGWVVQFQRREASVRSRAAIEHHKTSSSPALGHCPMARRRVTKRDPTNPGKKVKWDVWDQRECEQMREIYQRHVVEGEPIGRIAEDFFARNEKTAMGRLWVRRGRRTRKLEPRRLYKAVELVKEVLKLGDPGHPLLSGWLPDDPSSLRGVAEEPKPTERD